MNLAELNKVALAMVAPGQGILAADESSGTIKKRFDAIGVESTEDNRRDYREMLFRAADAMKSHLRRHPVRRDHLAEGQGRHAAGRADQEGRRPPRHQGRRGHQAAAVLSRRSRHQRPRQARRPAAEILRAGRALRQMARGDRYRRRHPELRLHPRQRARARALCRALPGGEHRADRRARSADGRRPRHRRAARRSPNGCSRRRFRSSTTTRSRSKASCSSRTW